MDSKLAQTTPWTALGYGSDLAICIAAHSQTQPKGADLFVLPSTQNARESNASRLVLSIKTGMGRRKNLVLDKISKETEQKIINNTAGSVVVVEEDITQTDGKKYIYLASVKPWPSRK